MTEPRKIKVEIKYRPVADLILHDKNPRKIEKEQFEILKQSILENEDYFEVRPILCTPDMVVFAGNMRLRAAIDLGLVEVPTAIMDIAPNKQRELMIRDNVQNGIWDSETLSAYFELAELQSWGYDPVAFGYKKDFMPVPPSTKLDEAQLWEYVCPDCQAKHVFKKSDLKPYVPET